MDAMLDPALKHAGTMLSRSTLPLLSLSALSKNHSALPGIDSFSDGAATTLGDAAGDYHCSCGAGWEGGGINVACTDINECDDANCGAGGTCSEATGETTTGHYTCSCSAGYSGGGFCSDDSCACLEGNAIETIDQEVRRPSFYMWNLER